MSYERWIEEAKRLAGASYSRFASLYSFRAAFEDGLSPRLAVKDCRTWLSPR